MPQNMHTFCQPIIALAFEDSTTFRINLIPPIYSDLLIFSLNPHEHLKVTTRLGASTMSSLVAGFRPLLSRFSLTQNFPEPLTKTSSPAANLDLIISRRASTSFDGLIDRISVFLGQRFDKIVFCEGHRSKVPKRRSRGREDQLEPDATYCFHNIFVNKIKLSL